ncbi:hypothetical protein [Vulgatibacter incomptus]|uniref:GspE/PulE/PilB domain-containing protein n=1 Tax=Vulgatibacter incomptus TaxID=1391653 RepID=UPI00146FDA04|nr:hypothetical protein [Vulgatibacter incomptus]
MTTTRVKLGELLLASGAIDKLQLEAALGHQRRWGGRLGEIVVDMRFAGDDRISGALARQLGVPAVDVTAREIPAEIIGLIPQALCEKHNLLAFDLQKTERGPGRLFVAMSDPTNLEAIDDLRFRTGMSIAVAAAPVSAIDAALRHYFHGAPLQLAPEIVTNAAPMFGDAPQFEFGTEAEEDKGPDMVVVELSDLFDMSPPPPSQSSSEAEQIAYLQLEVIERIEALARRTEDGDQPVPPWKLFASLVSLLVRQGIIRDATFLDELVKE